MSAHIAFPSISGTPGLPATLDPAILQRILVDSLQFDGLVVTDGLEMRGITNHYSPAEAAIMALHAGADILLLRDRKSTRLNSSHVAISYAVFCLKKKK